MHYKTKKWYALAPNSLIMGMLLAFVGGYLDAYTYITRDGVFATAQTGNTVLFAVRAASPEYDGALQNVPPFLAFIAGVLVAEHLKVRLVDKHRRAVLALECVILFIVGWLPGSVPNMIITISVAFVSSLQIGTFNKLGEWSYNSTITTGNLRTAASAFYDGFVNHHEEGTKKFIAFVAIIVSFINGALIGTFFSAIFEYKAIWIASGIILVTTTLYHRRIEQEGTEEPIEAEK